MPTKKTKKAKRKPFTMKRPFPDEDSHSEDSNTFTDSSAEDEEYIPKSSAQRGNPYPGRHTYDQLGVHLLNTEQINDVPPNHAATATIELDEQLNSSQEDSPGTNLFASAQRAFKIKRSSPIVDLHSMQQDDLELDANNNNIKENEYIPAKRLKAAKPLSITPTYFVYYSTETISLRTKSKLMSDISEAERRLSVTNIPRGFIQSPDDECYHRQTIFANQNRKNTDESFMFYVGDHELNLQIPVTEFDSEFLKAPDQFTHYVYQKEVHWSPNHLNYLYRPVSSYTKSSSNYPQPNFYRMLNDNEKSYYLLSVKSKRMSMHSEENTASYLFKIKDTDLNNSLLGLAALNHAYLVFESVPKTSFRQEGSTVSFSIKCEIYLGDVLKHDNFANDPSGSLRISESADMHFLMSYFFYDQIFSSVGQRLPSTADDREDISDEVRARANSKNAVVLNFKSENLFDLIYELRNKENSNANQQNRIDAHMSSVIQVNSCLKPQLRPYQTKAIRWMLARERGELDFKEELHPIYAKIVNTKGQKIFYHKFYGRYSTGPMPLKARSHPGGILADEMGLGKTLEILALILINKRENFKSEIKFEPNKKQIKSNCNSFSCLCGETPLQFRVGLYKQEKVSKEPEMPYLTCVVCGVSSHIDCLNYRGTYLF
jgi:hypothetical protein